METPIGISDLIMQIGEQAVELRAVRRQERELREQLRRNAESPPEEVAPAS